MLARVSPPITTTNRPHDPVLMKKATELEGQFLAEMLRHIGSATPSESFGGGIGEEQMSSFLRQAQADAIAKTGGIGLAKHFYAAMQRRQNAAP